MDTWVLLVLVVIALSISLVCWLLLGLPFKQAVGFLCDDERNGVREVSELFWQRLFLGLTLFIPLLFVLLFAPRASAELGGVVLSGLRWGLFGGVSVLLVLAYVVYGQIKLWRKLHWGEGVEPARYVAKVK